jgi:hypothetical protein
MKTLVSQINPVMIRITILFCLMSNIVLGQDSNVESYDHNSEGNFSLGLKVGPNFSTFSDSYFDTEGMVRFHIGVVMKFKLTDLFSIQPEVVYSQHGATFNHNFGDFEEEIDYLSVPILACYEVIEGLEIQAGPQLGWVPSIMGEDYETGDYGFTGGAQYTLPMNIFFQARYYFGLNNILYGYNRVGNISVGYLFNF